MYEQITYQNVHFSEHIICRDEIVGDEYSMWFHGMPKAIGICTNIVCTRYLKDYTTLRKINLLS